MRASESDSSLNVGYKNIRAITGSDGDILLIQNTVDCVFVMDENCLLWDKSELERLLQDSHNYFIMIGREELVGALPLGLDSICKVVQHDNNYTFTTMFPRAEHLAELGECILCEDSKSGKQFLEELLPSECVESANGKSNIGRKMRKLEKQSYTIVYDRSGINIDYEVLLDFCRTNGIRIVSEIDWDSFEAYILESPEYGIHLVAYPNKEIAAVKAMRTMFPEYDKSALPPGMKRPIYWKVEEAISCSGKARSQHSIKSVSTF